MEDGTRAGVRIAAPAKTNLFLHVGEKRADGYHELESLVAFTRFGDELLIEPDGEGLSLSIVGPFAKGLSSEEDNLVMRAARLLATRLEIGRGARMTLTKRIPLASGVGGGSADAAAALRGLVRVWNLDVPDGILFKVAADVGSDVPVCLAGSAAWMQGRGERVTLLPRLPDISVVLVNPRVGVATADAFKSLERRRGTGLPIPDTAFADARELVRYLEGATNDLEVPATRIAPIVNEVLGEIGKMPEVLLARMSGSGATCFGLVENTTIARGCADKLRKDHPDWWIVDTSLQSTE